MINQSWPKYDIMVPKEAQSFLVALSVSDVPKIPIRLRKV